MASIGGYLSLSYSTMYHFVPPLVSQSVSSSSHGVSSSQMVCG
jgi:hypothetical protein